MRSTNRSTAALLAGLALLAACDSVDSPLAPAPGLPAPRLATAPSGLIAFYSFDKDAGNGTVSDAVHLATGGFERGAFYFDGRAARIDLPVDINPSVRPAVTMGAWVRATTLPRRHQGQVLSHDDGGFDRSISLDPRMANGQPAPDSLHRYSAFSGESMLVGPVAEIDAWTFVAAVYTGSTVTLYVDGQQFTRQGSPGDGVDFLRVGGNPAGSISGEPFRGIIDNVFVFDRALSGGEIAYIRAGGACVLSGTPCIGEIREGLTNSTQLVAQAAADGEVTARQARQTTNLLAAADTTYLAKAARTTDPERERTMLQYVRRNLDLALAVIPAAGSAASAARDEMLRVRALVQSRLDAI